MNRQKGLFRLALVLSPVFGILAVVLNMFFVLDLDKPDTSSPFKTFVVDSKVRIFFGNGSEERDGGELLDVTRVGKPTLVQRVHGYMKGYDGNKYPLFRGVANLIAFLFGGNIPFFMYFSYKYVLVGFENEGDLAE